MNYRITFSKPDGIQFNTETFESAEAMADRIVEIAMEGYAIDLVESFEAHKDPENVRYDYETGEAIQYYDYADASEHHLRMMGG